MPTRGRRKPPKSADKVPTAIHTIIHTILGGYRLTELRNANHFKRCSIPVKGDPLLTCCGGGWCSGTLMILIGGDARDISRTTRSSQGIQVEGVVK